MASSLTRDLPISTEYTDSANISWCLKLLRGRTLFEIQDGYIGIGPPRAQPWDAACVLLGFKVPILLCPVSTVINTGFTVVGERYIHDLDDGVTLLGPLPSDWRILLGKGTSGYAAVLIYKNLRTNGVGEDDPLLVALPEEWRKIYREREPDDAEELSDGRGDGLRSQISVKQTEKTKGEVAKV